MKKIFIVAVSLFFLVSTVEAGQKDAKFKHLDKNKDGVVDETEINNWKPSKKDNSWWKKKADTNNDGAVSEEEAAAWKKLCNEKMDLNKDGKIDEKEKRKCWRHAKSKVNTKVEKQFDANQDGWLDESEASSMLKAKHEMVKTKGKAKVDTEIEKAYDTNKDGVISSNEAGTMKEDVNP